LAEAPAGAFTPIVLPSKERFGESQVILLGKGRKLQSGPIVCPKLIDVFLGPQHFQIVNPEAYPSLSGVRADLLWIDPKRFNPQRPDFDSGGFKGIRKGEKPVAFGRNHEYGGRLTYQARVSRDHAEVGFDRKGRLRLKDLRSEEGTRIEIPQEPVGVKVTP
jgi:hypothetical protein